MKTPNGLWTAIFFAVVLRAEWLAGVDSVAALFEQAGVIGAALLGGLAWLLKAYEEYRRVRGVGVVGTMDRGLDGRGFWSGFWVG